MPVLNGVVMGEGGNPVPRAKVYFVSAPVSVPEIAALTDGEGRFQLNAPAPGTYSLGAAKDDEGSGSLTVETGHEDSVGLIIRLHK